MKNKPFASIRLWKDSAMLAFAFLATIETVIGVADVSIDFIGEWWVRLLIIAAVYIILTIVILLCKYYRSRAEMTLDIRGIKVIVRTGNIFEANGWRVIPFNEYYDTQVDDVIIDKNSLNGKLITEQLDKAERESLKVALAAEDNSSLRKQFDEERDKFKYPLGRIKVFKASNAEYLLLALTHFNAQDEAHTNRAEFEQTLRTMWKEIDRTYANKPLFIPLIGAGKTRFDDMTTKPNAELLRCLLCTLRTSNTILHQPVTILLTREVLQTVNLYELKGA